MKKIIILIITLFSLSITAQEIKWMSFEEALEAQKETPKKIIMDTYTSWCGWCKKMDKETFTNKDVVNYINEHYYAVKFDAEGNETISFKDQIFSNPNYTPNKRGRNSSHQLTQYFGIRSFPTIAYLDEEANLIAPIPGYKTPSQIELYLKFFESDEYKNIKSKEEWQNYSSNFKSEFKD